LSAGFGGTTSGAADGGAGVGDGPGLGLGVGIGTGTGVGVGVGAGGGTTTGTGTVTELLAADGDELPTAFVATTENVYAVPAVMPLAVQDVPVGGQLTPAGDERTVYEVIGEPPSLAGAAHETVTLDPTCVAAIAVGTAGTTAGTSSGNAVDAALLLTALVATTMNAYVAPGVRPLTSQVVAGGVPVAMQPRPSVADVTAYAVIPEPPSNTGATQTTCAVPTPASVAVTDVGASGTVAGISTPADANDNGLSPMAFVANTLKVYVSPRVSPKTVQDAAGGEAFDVHVNPPGDDVARYDVIVEPPSLAGASHDTSTLVPATTPKTAVG
jgi:hypothetical protein